MSSPRQTGIEKLRAEGIFKLKAYTPPGRCVVAFCRKAARTIKGKPQFLCPCHHQQRWRMGSKKKSAYATLRDHAKARGLEFSISFEYMEGLLDCAAAWDIEAEKRGDVVTVDRISEEIGYRKGNLQVITLSENVAKNNRLRRLPAYVQSIIARKRAKVQAKLESYEEWQERTGDPF